MNAKLAKIRYELQDIAEEEATKLYRLAWKAQEHGVDKRVVEKLREEANELHMTAYPERLLDPFKKWEYAFKF